MSTLKDYFCPLSEDSESENTTAIDATEDEEAFAADDDESVSSSSVSGVKRKAGLECKSRVVKRRKGGRESESSSSSSSSKQRVSGISMAWKTEFNWLEGTDDGMVCALCRKFSRRPQKCVPGKAAWVDIPCKTIRRSALVAHKESRSHCEAVQMEVALQASGRDGGIERALDSVVTAQRRAFIAALKCMYFLNKKEIPHTTNFVPLLDLAKSLGVEYLNDLYVGENAAYRSERFVQEIVLALGEVLVRKFRAALKNSPFFVLMIDETTDVAVLKQLVIYARYITDSGVQTRFLGMLNIPDGTALTIVEAVTKFCDDWNLDINQKLCGLGSDGASVMLGRRGGVATLLKARVPFMIANHCVAHRLALACGQASNEVPYLRKFKAILDQLYRFYDNSPVRTAGLHGIQEVLNEPSLKLSQAKDVRWLSHEKAVNNLRKCLSAVIISLEREATERTCVEAHGLAVFVQKYEFVATLFMLSDVLPPLAQLSRAFQTENIDFSMVRPLVAATISTIQTLKDHPGEHFKSLPDALRDLQKFNISNPSSEQRERYVVNIYKKYMSTLVQHLESRFPDVGLIEAFSIFDVKSLPEDPVQCQSAGTTHLDTLCAHYGPHGVIAADSLKPEYPLFVNSVKADDRLGKLSTREVMEALVENNTLQAMFPNLAKIAAIGLLLPMSTADCERGFSALQRIKTNLRNRLSNRILNNLLLISIEGPSPADFPYNDACDIWAGWRNRRIQVKI